MPDTEETPVPTTAELPPPPPPTVTAPSAWRTPDLEGTVVTLPSGNNARLRRTLDLLILLKTGQIPNPLMADVSKMIQGEKTMEIDRMDGDAFLALMKLVDDCIPGIFVEPKVVPLPDPLPSGFTRFTWAPDDPSAISIEKLDQSDRMFAFSYAQGGPTDLQRFHEEQKSALATVSNVPVVPNITIPASGTHG